MAVSSLEAMTNCIGCLSSLLIRLSERARSRRLVVCLMG